MQDQPIVAALEWERNRLMRSLAIVNELLRLSRIQPPPQVTEAVHQAAISQSEQRQPSRNAGDWITVERDVLMSKISATMPFQAVYAEVCKLPGPIPRIETVRHRAFQVLKLPRYTPPPEPYERRPVTLAELRAAAAEWGLTVTSWDDLRAVNAHADRIAHPGFKRKLHE